MLIAVELDFTDDPRRLDARPDHRNRLAELHATGTLLAAGPWEDDSGALLIFKASTDAVRAIMQADPYYATLGVRVVSVRPWRPIIGSGDVPTAPAPTTARE